MSVEGMGRVGSGFSARARRRFRVDRGRVEGSGGIRLPRLSQWPWRVLAGRALALGCVSLFLVNAPAARAEDPQARTQAQAPTQTQAPASLPSKMLANVSFDPLTGLVIGGGSSRLELHGYTWFRAQTDTRVGGETDLQASVPLGRIFMNGSVLDSKLHFFAQTEFAGGSPKLLDLFAEWRFNDALHLRIGQFRTPFSRAYIAPLTNMELPTRGFVIDRFNLGRDTGAMASGTLAAGLFHYDLAVVNGATINDHKGNRDAPSVIARTEFRFGDPVPYNQAPSLTLEDPHGVTLGFGGSFSRRAVKSAAGTSTEQLWNAAADLAWMHGPLSFRVESFLRSAHNSPRSANAFGVYSQLGVFVLPRLLEVGGRVGWVSDGADVESYEAFMATYWKSGSYTLGHHLKTILSYRMDTGDPTRRDLRDRHLVRVQVQLFF